MCTCGLDSSQCEDRLFDINNSTHFNVNNNIMAILITPLCMEVDWSLTFSEIFLVCYSDKTNFVS